MVLEAPDINAAWLPILPEVTDAEFEVPLGDGKGLLIEDVAATDPEVADDAKPMKLPFVAVYIPLAAAAECSKGVGTPGLQLYP